jgi:SP family general alpha glucoside:H+ symporter-like MFS transporter
MVAKIVIPYLVNPDEADLGGKVGFIFGGLGAIGTVWTWFYLPETKGRTVDELDALFEARIAPRKFHSTRVGDFL